MEQMLQVCLGKSPGTGANSRPLNRHALFLCCRSQRGLPLNGPFLKVKADKENPNMKRFLRKYLRATWVRLPLLIVGFTLLLAVSAFGQTGTSPWENAVSVLQTAFTSTIARGLSLVAIVVAGLTFAFGEGGSKRVLAGVLFGVGMAIAAVNFLAWLFPGA
jgi:type IV secretory pathway VirB2 component (pilin)